jgi:gamma-glutamyl:cysteine ligase YbdK (ATP-grasp superfamily)
MIVDRDSLDIRPVCDALLRRLATRPDAIIEEEENGQPSQVALEEVGGGISVSNELVLHVVEFKTTDPAPSLAGLADKFQNAVRIANEALAAEGCMLLPTGMHPWMDPFREHVKLWPHGYGQVYAAFNRIFDCRGHGWSNLQSVHLNLPFANDEEFGRLHAAIRFVLPLLPGLAASSPFVEGRATGILDSRMEAYRKNSDRVPQVRGLIVPEPAYTFDEYDRRIFQPLYKAIAPLDPEGVLQHEWLNARGAIARFSRGAIEIRVLDVQECPAADLAVVALVVAAVRAIATEHYGPIERFMTFPTEPLAELLLAAIRDADRAPVRSAEYVSMFAPPRAPTGGGGGGGGGGVAGGAAGGVAEFSAPGSDHPTMNRLWTVLAADLAAAGFLSPEDHAAAEKLLRAGSLARRLVEAETPETPTPTHARLREVYSSIASCLADGRPFLP